MGSAFYGERLRDIVYWVMVGYFVWDEIACNIVMGNFFPSVTTQQKLNRTFPRPPRISTLMDAPTLNRRRITEFGKPNSVSRSRTIS